MSESRPDSARRPRAGAPLLTAFAALLLAGAASAAVPPGLKGGQVLFQQNRWEEARAHLRASWDDLSSSEQSVARFLIGRAFTREAELYRAVRQFSGEVGLDYLKELGAQKENRGLAYIPLFEGFYELDAGDPGQAATVLGRAARLKGLPASWVAVARTRRTAALAQKGDRSALRALAADKSVEALFWRLIEEGTIPPASFQVSRKAGRLESLEAACLLLRAERRDEAGKALTAIQLDAPDVEIKPDPQKVLRFFDPAVVTAWERVCWERAIAVLSPLASSRSTAERQLGTHYAALSLYRLGSETQAAEWLERNRGSSPDKDTAAVARLLQAAVAWSSQPPDGAALEPLWQATASSPEAVLLWGELSRSHPALLKPIAREMDGRLARLPDAFSGRRHGSLAGRWGLARLASGDDSRAVLSQLTPFRDHANKNKLENNDPLLLLAIAACNYRNAEYAQSLETLFELAKTLPGLRGLQWNLQGIYAARQKAGGEARISQ